MVKYTNEVVVWKWVSSDLITDAAFVEDSTMRRVAE